MKKIIYILFAAIMPLCYSCSADDDAPEVSVPQKEDNYYVKYEAQGHAVSGAHKYVSMNVDVSTPDGTKNYKTESALKTTFSQTFGPVKKGFVTNIMTSGCTYMNCQIYVSVNEEPFALKAEGTSSAKYKIE